SSSGLYTAPAIIASQQTLTIKATSQADATVAGTATVTLLPVTITISPSTKTLFAAQGQQFVSTITQAANTLVNWSITPAGIGSVNSAGFYQAPSSISNQQTVTVTATSQADTNKTSSATVTLQPVGITLAPTSVTLTALQTQQFSASVSAPNVEVTWSLSPSVGTGTISSTGLYTAP